MSQSPSRAAERVGSSAIRDLLDVAGRPGLISLAGGIPAPESLPLDALRAVFDRVVSQDPVAAFQYGPTEGFGPLREWIAQHHDADAANVLVTTGSQQALDLVARASLTTDDAVVVPDPCYVGAAQVLRLAGARLEAVTSDRDGLRVDDLESLLRGGTRPKCVYVVPNFDNPTGATLSADRRVRLAELSDHYGFLVVADDPYAELRFAGEPIAPLSATPAWSVRLGSFSKVVSPGLRVGYVIAPPALYSEGVVVKQALDLHTSSLSQRLVHGVVNDPAFEARHLPRIRHLYSERACALTHALEVHFGESITFDRPHGGMFVWARSSPAVDTEALLPGAVEAGVAYVPGPAFAVRASARDLVRLSFATASPDEIEEGVRRLRSVWPA